jgi:phage minor structural protein
MGVTMGFIPTLFWFDRFDVRRSILRPCGPLTHVEELCGEDTIAFDCEEVPDKGDRLVWRDPSDGRWREHVVVRTVQRLGLPCRVHAEGSLTELLCDYIEERWLKVSSAGATLSEVLAPTRWQVGTVDVGTATRASFLYHVNSLAALRRIEGWWGCEAEPSVTIADGRVSARRVSLRRAVGQDRGLRLTYAKNMAGCTRTVLDDEVLTALYGYGAGLPATDEAGNLTGGYRRKLTFGSVNGGVDWVGDEAAREAWGLWDAGRAKKRHRFGEVTFSDCDDASRLKALTMAALKKACVPKVSYEVDAALVDGADAVGLGDVVTVVDTSRTPGWRVRARVVGRRRTFAERLGVRVTIGQARQTSWSASSDVTARVAFAEDAAAAAGVAATAAGTGVAQIQAATGAAAGDAVPALATKTYVDQAIASLDDLMGMEF